MKNGPLVSMIVPVYNKRDYLRTCVDSLCAQTYTNLEIILVDDGSTDGSGELCDAYARRDPRIRVTHQVNGGVSSARNTGLDTARGDYIYFSDADDRVLETMAAEMVSTYEREGCDLCVGGIMARDEQEESNSYHIFHLEAMLIQFPTLRKKHRFLCRWILNNKLGWSVNSQVWRRDIIERHHLRFKDGQKIYEDMDFFFRYTACCQNLRYIPQMFYIYRQHADSVMHTSNEQELLYWMLCLTRSWNDYLDASCPPAYICAGVVYIRMFVDVPLRTEADKKRAARIIHSFRTSENGEWLLGQARLAVRNWGRILRICGLYLGLRVYAFYKSVLTGDMSAFYQVNQLRLWSETLCAWKRTLLPDR